MWYVIVAGAGLAVGLALLIWGLRERAARHKAEKEVYDLQQKVAWTEAASDTWKVQCKAQRDELARLEAVRDTLKRSVSLLEERLVACHDAETIKKLLDEELDEEEV